MWIAELEETYSPLEELEGFYMPDKVIEPRCRKCHRYMTYRLGYWVCPKCKVKVWDTLER